MIIEMVTSIYSHSLNILGIFYFKDGLSNIYSAIMLISAALGTGFLSAPYVFYKFPIESIFTYFIL